MARRRIQLAGVGFAAVVGAFTLMEMLVVVAIVALVAAGMAAIFAAVGDTVTTGRRLSAVNRYAVLAEVVIREDFKNITRDGFLVLRNELAYNGGKVPLYPGESPVEQRLRRTDEIMFFTRGDYVSARRPLAPGYTATGSEARIWYGHGERKVEDLVETRAPSYLYPWPGDRNTDPDTRLGWPALTAGAENPNLYASDWTLLRHQTVLTPPAAGEGRVPRDPVFDLDPDAATSRRRLRDHPWQVALQPAATSVFRTKLDDVVDLGQTGSGNIGNLFGPSIRPLTRPNFMVRQGDHAVWPRYSSGLVDVCTEPLADIRSVVTSVDRAPANTPDDHFTVATGFDPTDVATRQNARLWMLDALPVEYGPPGTSRHRMRYEPVPPLLNIPRSLILGGGDPTDINSAAARILAYREADQEMLTANMLIPRCSEFIVEWSFGGTYPANDAQGRAGQLQWFGLDRAGEDTNGDGQIDPATDVRVAESFSRAIVGDLIPDNTELNRINTLVMGGGGGGGGFVGGMNRNIAEATFGYYDPGTNTASAADDEAWPWPKLVRLTITFTDPNDPTIEATTQFVVEIPGGGLD